MAIFNQPIAEIIRQRFSCRSYDKKPIKPGLKDQLSNLLAASSTGPLGGKVRLELVASSEDDLKALNGLGTYGFIKGASAFMVGAVDKTLNNMEDFGYLVEQAILFATDRGLGTCWLGGSFSKSSFSREILLEDSEILPAVIAAGYPADKRRWLDSFIRSRAKSDKRWPWNRIFFEGDFLTSLSADRSGKFATPLEMVRLGPSASNKQPWRIVKDGKRWHFYLQRTKGYANLNMDILKLADMQRIDMGIAMCHFELALREMGLSGGWVICEPGIEMPDELTEYIVTWQPKD